MKRKFEKLRINSSILKSEEEDEHVQFYYKDIEPEPPATN